MKTKNTYAETESSNKMTTIKTSYARAAIVLLALNFCLTTYAVLALNNTTQDQIDQVNGLNTGGALKAAQPSPERVPGVTQTRESEK